MQFKMAAKGKFSSTPASVIYSQSWPVPTSNSISQCYPANANSNSQKRILNNSPWICKTKQQGKKPPKVSSPTIHKSQSWASSMLNSNYPGWLENDSCMLGMASEFKITLQMFRKLTNQVKEVDEQLNSGRNSYSFKHYFSNKKYHNVGRGKLRTYTPEVPMTNEEYQPCNNLGFKRESQEPLAQFKTYRNSNIQYQNTSNLKQRNWHLLNTEASNAANWQLNDSFVDESDNESDKSNQTAEVFEKENFENKNSADMSCGDEEISWSSCLKFNDEDNHIGLGYIEPVPEDWEAKKLEELELEYCSDSSESDPFMVRYLQLRRLEIETIEHEKRNGSNSNTANSGSENGVSKVANSNKSSKKSGNGKKQASKVNRLSENGEKTPRRFIKQSSMSSLPDFEGLCLEKGRNLKEKCKWLGKGTKQNTKQKTQVCGRRIKSAKGKRRVQSCKARPVSYHSAVTYNILELATSFDPPGKERMKLNTMPVTAKSARSKGMLPGKTWSSQRRFSLTAGQSLQDLPSEPKNDSVVSKSRTTSAKKSNKRTTKQCSSSKY